MLTFLFWFVMYFVVGGIGTIITFCYLGIKPSGYRPMPHADWPPAIVIVCIWPVVLPCVAMFYTSRGFEYIIDKAILKCTEHKNRSKKNG